MEHIHVEVIGHILFLVGAAHHVVIVSLMCWEWPEAFCNHLHSLTFDDNKECTVYRRFSTSKIETLITKTIFQTTGLQCLSITMDGVSRFFVDFVINWLICTSRILRQFHYNLRTTPHFSIVEKFNASKMEVLDLVGNILSGRYKIFLCLRCLSLSHVVVSPLDLSFLLSACPIIKVLNLDSLEFVMLEAQKMTMEQSSSTLKETCLQYNRFNNLISNADSVEKLQVKKCEFKAFVVLGKGTLRFLEIDDASASHIDLGENFQNLKVVNVIYFEIMWEKFHHMITRSSGLRKLKLWYADFDKIVNMEYNAICFLLSSYLALYYNLRDVSPEHSRVTHYNLEGSYYFDNAVALELQCPLIDCWFPLWLEDLLEKFPKLKKLVIHGLEFLEVHIYCNRSIIDKCSVSKAEQLDFGVSSKYEVNSPSKFLYKVPVWYCEVW